MSDFVGLYLGVVVSLSLLGCDVAAAGYLKNTFYCLIPPVTACANDVLPLIIDEILLILSAIVLALADFCIFFCCIANFMKGQPLYDAGYPSCPQFAHLIWTPGMCVVILHSLGLWDCAHLTHLYCKFSFRWRDLDVGIFCIGIFLVF